MRFQSHDTPPLHPQSAPARSLVPPAATDTENPICLRECICYTLAARAAQTCTRAVPIHSAAESAAAASASTAAPSSPYSPTSASFSASPCAPRTQHVSPSPSPRPRAHTHPAPRLGRVRAPPRAADGAQRRVVRRQHRRGPREELVQRAQRRRAEWRVQHVRVVRHRHAVRPGRVLPQLQRERVSGGRGGAHPRVGIGEKGGRHHAIRAHCRNAMRAFGEMHPAVRAHWENAPRHSRAPAAPRATRRAAARRPRPPARPAWA